jgi:hypothetical protein
METTEIETIYAQHQDLLLRERRIVGNRAFCEPAGKGGWRRWFHRGVCRSSLVSALSGEFTFLG